VKTTRADITSATAVQFIEPMYALAVQNIPKGEEWLYEVKFDGYRCLAGRNSKQAHCHRGTERLDRKKIPPSITLQNYLRSGSSLSALKCQVL